MNNYVIGFKMFESKFSKLADKYIETDYTPRWKETPQRYLNKKDSKKLKVLQFIYDAGEEGRSYGDIQRFYFNLGADEEGKREAYDHDQFKWDKKQKKVIKIPGKGKEYREYDSSKDRGMGGTLFSGGDWRGRPTGILHAHCTKNEKGKWVLTDSKLIKIFDLIDIDDEGDVDMLKNLGLFD